jgi:hypothetical protein
MVSLRNDGAIVWRGLKTTSVFLDGGEESVCSGGKEVLKGNRVI